MSTPVRMFRPGKPYLLTSLIAGGRRRLNFDPLLAALVRGAIAACGHHTKTHVEFFTVVPEACAFLVRATTEKGMSDFMREIKELLARMANALDETSGPAFDRRFEACELADLESQRWALVVMLAWSLRERAERGVEVCCDALDGLLAPGTLKGVAPTKRRALQACTKLVEARKRAAQDPEDTEDVEDAEELDQPWRIRLAQLGLTAGLSRKMRQRTLKGLLGEARALLGATDEDSLERQSPRLFTKKLKRIKAMGVGAKERENEWRQARAFGLRAFDEGLEAQLRSTPKPPPGFAQPVLITSGERSWRLSVDPFVAAGVA